MKFSTVTAAYGEPIHLDEARLHLKSQSDITEDDTLITASIASVRQYAEQETGRRLIAQKLRMVIDAFPEEGDIVIHTGPVQAVTAVKYLDDAGALQTLSTALYQVDLYSEPARIRPAYGQSWPTTRDEDLSAVRIEFIVGYAAPMTADATADSVTLRGWPTLAVDDTVRFSNSGGALPGGLSASTDYYVRSVVSAGVYTLSATSGGSLLDITGAGTGSHFVGEVPNGIKSWMKLQLGTLDQVRESAVVGSPVNPLPHVDRLLDPFRLYA